MGNLQINFKKTNKKTKKWDVQEVDLQLNGNDPEAPQEEEEPPEAAETVTDQKSIIQAICTRSGSEMICQKTLLTMKLETFSVNSERLATFFCRKIMILRKFEGSVLSGLLRRRTRIIA